MTFLTTTGGGGYPLEYLQGRIGGRRSCRVSDWFGLIAAPDPRAALPAAPWRCPAAELPEGAWPGLQRECSWVHDQLEPRARRQFAPVFGWFEIRTILLCLRRCAAGDDAKLAALLGRSLISGRLKTILLREHEIGSACREISRALAVSSPVFERLASAYAERGLGGFEQRLSDLYLEQAISEAFTPAVAAFIAGQVDLRNLMTLYKQLRWRIASPAPFIRGGSIGGAALRDCLAAGGVAGLRQIIRQLTGAEPSADASPEPHLLTWLTGMIRRRRITDGVIGELLDHLWYCYLESRNLGIVLRGVGLNPDTMVEELIP